MWNLFHSNITLDRKPSIVMIVLSDKYVLKVISVNLYIRTKLRQIILDRVYYWYSSRNSPVSSDKLSTFTER